jgi:uncharacterized membrane protein YoaK (UPF0700 family)
MHQQNNIRNFTLLLAIVAGFCDTITFVASREFSSHVTGNFIIFAYDIIKGADTTSWIKLMSFPVFVIAVMTGGWIISKTSNKCSILLWEGIILAITGFIMLIFKLEHLDSVWLEYSAVMPIVFAMGLQNAFGKLFGKETYGPTTIMTGNVTQAALDLWEMLKAKFSNDVLLKSFKDQSYTLGGFLIGCLLGAVAGEITGLSAVLLPGIALIIYPKKMDVYSSAQIAN